MHHRSHQQGGTSFTIVLETKEPFGPETRIMHEEAEDAEEAALRALHRWHNDMDFDPTNQVGELEDGTARVLAVLEVILRHCLF